MSRIQVAVALEKEEHPERFCAEARCLWRTDEEWCPRHGGGDENPDYGPGNPDWERDLERELHAPPEWTV